jgi:hypothetical protein
MKFCTSIHGTRLFSCARKGVTSKQAIGSTKQKGRPQGATASSNRRHNQLSHDKARRPLSIAPRASQMLPKVPNSAHHSTRHEVILEKVNPLGKSNRAWENAVLKRITQKQERRNGYLFRLLSF